MRKPVDIAAALAAAEDRPPQRLTFSELCAGYFARHPHDASAERLGKWTAALGVLDAWSVSTEQLELAAEALRSGGYKESSVNRDVSAIGTVYKWARQARLAPKGFQSPTLAFVRRPGDIRRVSISCAEIERLRAGALVSPSPGFGAYVHCLIDSGARKSEVLERRWGDFDPKAGTLLAEKTKTGAPRVLFLQPPTADLLGRLGGPDPDPAKLIFPGKFPDQPRDYRRPWLELTAAVGRPDLRQHDLRRHAAQRLLASGVTAAVAAQVLGHGVEVLDRRYGHLETEHLRAAVERSWSAAA